MAMPSDLTTYLDAARAAIDDGDHEVARRKIALAKTVLAEIPDSTDQGAGARWANSIAALESAVRDLQSLSGGGIISQPLEFG